MNELPLNNLTYEDLFTADLNAVNACLLGVAHLAYSNSRNSRNSRPGGALRGAVGGDIEDGASSGRPGGGSSGGGGGSGGKLGVVGGGRGAGGARGGLDLLTPFLTEHIEREHHFVYKGATSNAAHPWNNVLRGEEEGGDGGRRGRDGGDCGTGATATDSAAAGRRLLEDDEVSWGGSPAPLASNARAAKRGGEPARFNPGSSGSYGGTYGMTARCLTADTADTADSYGEETTERLLIHLSSKEGTRVVSHAATSTTGSYSDDYG
jgi:hypothetical protein